jgi:putative effector of murein hydrolase LrgA (UPF0299 family)
MLGSITLLLVYQLVGEAIARLLYLPVPGPVVGMALLFATLLFRGGVPQPLAETTQGMLEHLSLLFVPAGVGVMLHVHLVASEWKPIAAALIGSTLLTIAVTALVMRALSGPAAAAGDGEDGGQ